MTSVMGRNGTGKSTFLKCLAGAVPVPKPSLFLDGRNLAPLRVGERARFISYVPQELTLAQSTEIFLLDEPTTFLDPKHEVEVMNLCWKLALDKGKTVIVTLHNLEMAAKYSDVMVFMKEGKVVASGRPDEVLNTDLLEQVYDLPMSIVTYDGRKIILR